MRVRVVIHHKAGVFDPEGATIAQSLHRLGFGQVREVRACKVIELELDVATREEAEAQARAMCEAFLVNPVMQRYTLEPLEG